MRKLVGKLTYANVMSSVAVFIALSAGAYAVTKAPKNSVVSSSIKDRQVKPGDLATNVRAIRFSYSKPIGTIVQSNVLNKGGYRIVAQCLEDSDRPEVEVGLVYPKNGVLDGLQMNDTGPGSATPIVGRLPVEGGEPIDATINASPTADEEVWQMSGAFTYTAAGRSALTTLNLRADDTVDRCTVTGALVPLN